MPAMRAASAFRSFYFFQRIERLEIETRRLAGVAGEGPAASATRKQIVAEVRALRRDGEMKSYIDLLFLALVILLCISKIVVSCNRGLQNQSRAPFLLDLGEMFGRTGMGVCRVGPAMRRVRAFRDGHDPGHDGRRRTVCRDLSAFCRGLRGESAVSTGAATRSGSLRPQPFASDAGPAGRRFRAEMRQFRKLEDGLRRYGQRAGRIGFSGTGQSRATAPPAAAERRARSGWPNAFVDNNSSAPDQSK